MKGPRVAVNLLARAGADLQAERQQRGPGRAPLCPAGGRLPRPLPLVPRRLPLLAAVQQHGLDAVSVGQEERVALTGGQVPHPKALGQLRCPPPPPHGTSQERNSTTPAGKPSEKSEKQTHLCLLR